MTYPHGLPQVLSLPEILSDQMHTLPRNSSRRSISALCHLLCEAERVRSKLTSRYNRQQREIS